MILLGLPFGLSAMPIVEFVGGTGTGVVRTGSSLTLPSGMMPGDFVILATMCDDTTADLASGYTNGQSVNRFRWAYKFMPDPVDTEATGLDTDLSVHLALAFRNVNPSSPFAATSPSVIVEGSGTPNPSAITPVFGGAMIVAIAGWRGGTASASATAPNSYIIGASSQNASSFFYGVAAAHRRNVPANVTQDPGPFGISADSLQRVATIALRPK